MIDLNLPDHPPDGKEYWVGEDQILYDDHNLLIPYFTWGDVSSFFFGKSRYWLKWHYTNHPEWFEGLQVYHGSRGYRYMSLAEVEDLAHRIYRIQKMDKYYDIRRLNATIALVKYEAYLHGYLDKDGYKLYPTNVKGRVRR